MRRTLSRAGLAALIVAATMSSGATAAHAADRSAFNLGTVSGDRSTSCEISWAAISFHDQTLDADGDDPADTGIPTSPQNLMADPQGNPLSDPSEVGFHTAVHPDLLSQTSETSDGSFYIDHTGLGAEGSSSGPTSGDILFTYVIHKETAAAGADIDVSLPPLDGDKPLSGWTFQDLTVAALSSDYPNAASVTSGPTSAGETLKFTADFPDKSFLVLRFRARLSSEDLNSQPDHLSDTFGAAGALTADTCGTVSGHAWVDEDADNERDAGEGPKAEVKVDLLRDGTVVASQVTDADGAYAFAEVPNGTYDVAFEGGQRSTISVQTNDVVVDQPYRDAALGTITGVTWVDMDRDGRRTADEPAQPGIRVELRNATSGAVVATQVSDNQGAYTFDNVPAGTYDVWFHEGDQHRVSVDGDTLQVDQPYLPAEEPAPSPTGTTSPSPRPTPEPTIPVPEPTAGPTHEHHIPSHENPVTTVTATHTETKVLQDVADKTLAYTGGAAPMLFAVAALIGGIGVILMGGARQQRRGRHE